MTKTHVLVRLMKGILSQEFFSWLTAKLEVPLLPDFKQYS